MIDPNERKEKNRIGKNQNQEEKEKTKANEELN